MLPTLPGVARRVSGALATSVLALLLVTCSDSPIAPRGAFRAGLAIVPRFEANARLAPLVIDKALVVVSDAATEKEITREERAFNGDQVQLTVVVPLTALTQDVTVSVTLSAGGVVLFQGSQQVTLTAGGRVNSADLPVTYVGPGAEAVSVLLEPQDTVVQPGGTFSFHPRAFDFEGVELPDFYVHYALVNPPAGATIDAAGSFTAPTARDTVVVAVTLLPSQAVDTTRVFVIPAPAALVKQAGDNQSGTTGARLAQLLAAQVNGNDGQPVPGVSVAFAVASGGGSVDSATATTDASGIARTGAVLGAAVGGQSFTATVTGIAPVTFTATATAPAVTAVPLAAGGDHSCEIRGAVTYCWGENSTGALGDGTTTNRLVATPVAGATTFIAVALGNSHSCALTAAGAAYCWGDNSAGELGDGTTTSRAVAQAVTGGHNFLQLAAGDRHTCGLTVAGQIYCWGLNTSGQLGTGNTTNATAPVLVGGATVFKAVSAEGNHTCGLSTTGAAFCWGLNSNGELGDGTLTSRNSPTAVSGGLTFTAISVGNRSSCAIATGGTGYCWGFNFGAQLTAPTQVGGGFSYTALDMGGDHICGLTSGGWRCGGRNASGQLGDGTTTDAPSPVLPSGGFTYSIVAGGASHTCGITSTGTRCWGLNTSGQLGTGATSQQLTPTVSRGPAATVAVNAGNGQSVTAGSAVPVLPSVLVRDAQNVALPGVEVTFAVTAGGGSATGTTAITNASGIATVGSWTTGATPGANSLVATVAATGVTGNPVTFTATGTAPGNTLTWTGQVSTDFATAGNWSPAVAPSATSDIVIVAATNIPVLGSNLTVKSLTVNPGGTLNIGFNTLNVAGSVLIDGTLAGGGAIQITAAGQVRGAMAQLVILAPVTAAGNVTTSASSNLNISAGGDFTVNGKTITVGGSITTVNGGFLTMTNPADQVSAINASFGGGDQAGRLIAGSITLTGGLFTVGATPANRGPLSATGNHKFVFTGAGTHQIQGLAGASTVQIANLDVSQTTGDFALTTQTATPVSLQIAGTLTAKPTGATVRFHGLTGASVQAASVNISRLAVDSIRFIVGQSGVAITQFDSVAFTNQDPTVTQLTVSHPGAATPFTFTALSFASAPTSGRYLAAVDEAAADGQVLTINMAAATPAAPSPSLFAGVNGAVINWPPAAPTPSWTGATSTDWSVGSNWSTGTVPGASDSVLIPVTALTPSLSANVAVGAVHINGGTLTINGHTLTIARSLTTSGNGKLVMTNAGDVVIVGGNATFGGGSTNGFLTAGTIQIQGNFAQLALTSTQSFAATFPHTVFFPGAGPQISFASPGANASHFGRLVKSFGSTLTLGSDVYVAGQLTGTDGAAGNIKGTCGKTLTVQSLISSGVTLDCISLIVDDPTATGTGLSSVTFVNQVTGATQLSLIHPGPSYGLSNITFDLLAAGAPGLYISALDFTSGTTPLVVTVLSNNPGNGPAFTATSGGAVVNWPGTTSNWLGTTSADFSNGANWSGGIVPTASNNVVIPAGTPFSPTLSTTVFMNDLTVNAGATLDLADQVLGVGGALAVNGRIIAPGQNAGIVLTGTGKTMHGIIEANVSLAGSYALDGRVLLGVDTLPVVIAVTGGLTLGGHTLQLWGDFATSNTGTVTMTQAIDTLWMTGSALFNGGSTDGLMTNGTLIVGSEIIAVLGSPTAFAPSGSHVTVSLGSNAGAQFATPGTGAAGSHFANLDLTQMDSGFDLNSDVFVDGTLSATGNSAQIQGAGHTLTALQWQVDQMTVQNTTMVLNEQGVQRAQQFDNVFFQLYPATGATQMRVIMQGGSSSARTVSFSGLQFEAKGVGGGSFYLDATANVATGLIVNLPLSNQGATANGNGPALTKTTGSVTVNWP